MRTPRQGSRLRAAALLSAGALGVHQLRYLLAFGGSSDHALSRQGHGYLAWAAPLVAGLLALALAQLLARIARSRVGAVGRRGRGRSAEGFLRLWLAASAALVTIYSAQETLEGLFASGHPDGLVGIAGQGGWIAFPLALALGALIALLLRGAEVLLADRGTSASLRGWLSPARRACPAAVALAPTCSPIALNLGGRAPPLLLR